MPEFDIVLLDLDDTVFDFKKAEKYALFSTAKDFGVNCSEQDYIKYSEINSKVWQELEKGLIDRKSMRLKRFSLWFEYMNVNLSEIDFNNRYIENLSNCGFLIDGAEDFLKKLSSFCDVYAVTNGLEDTQLNRLKLSGINRYLKGAFISQVVGFNKPHKEFFDYCFEKIGVQDKSRYIILGDSLSSDMQGGRNAGIATCLFSRAEKQINNPLCDFVVSDYNEFFYVLNKD